ncbi:carboxypeptidase D-like [Pelobates cultripes]|uniref:Carboxypeptidase D-like n=1 Tax=Pelobates cultripes TaxID=61616 RepID=A0AAD1WLH2_PELCU|nr:carboxypeptidase D-like [Pelobates cultripes]
MTTPFPLHRLLQSAVQLAPEVSKDFVECASVPLWVLCVGRFPDVHRMGIPEVKYIANIHGNEPVGRELLLHFINYLVHNYKHNEDIEALVNSTRIHFLPALNPDGFKTSVPGDCQGSQGRTQERCTLGPLTPVLSFLDLNRNFPSIFGHNLSPLQPETLAAMQWFQSETFVLSATLHGGALVAVYPFSFSVEGHHGKAKSPDDDIFKYLTKTYANAHKTMHKGDFCNETFPGGITNAAAWYPVLGCLQDYNYIKGQCFEITLEVSCCKYPREDQLPRLWDENKQALLELIKQVHKGSGIKGRVVDTSGNSVPKATIQFTTRKKKYVYQANNYGEFYKILIPGKYKVRVKEVSRKCCALSYLATEGTIVPGKRVVGLGNHGMGSTRHSVGMVAVNLLARRLNIADQWKTDKQSKADIVQTQIDGLQLVLLKPRQFMNINGHSVAKAAEKFNLTPEYIYLLHDELDKPIGKVSLKLGGSASAGKSLGERIERCFVRYYESNEPVGRELLLHFINYLVHNYKHNEDIEALVNSTRIHFLPALNPDGFKTSVPGDCQGSQGRTQERCTLGPLTPVLSLLDLNRNFPSIFGHNLSPLQPETLAAMQWFQSETFVLSATLHGGALVAVYPFSFSVEGHHGKAKSPDDDIFKYLTKTYANAHKTMHKGDFCNETFPGGITNAAAWYPVLGCLQDYNYIKGQCFEITLEVSCCKYPREDQLPRLWDENKQALLELIKQVHKGIKGRVVDTSGNSVPKATIQFTTRKKKYVYQANNYGEFYKILIPGKYKVRVKAQGYLSETKLVIVTDKISSYSAITQNFILKKQENKKKQ